MKKYLAVLVALLVVATGCGNTKKLNCTIEKNGMNGAYNMEFDKNDQLTKMTMIISEDFDEELTKDEVEEYKTTVDAICKGYNTDYVDCKTEITTKLRKATVTYNINKMTDAQKEQEGVTKEETTYEAMRETVEGLGFTCK